MSNTEKNSDDNDNYEIIPPCAGALASLGFEDSLDPKKFAEATDHAVVSYINAHFADGAVVSLQTIKSWATQFEMSVAASSETTRAMRKGAAFVRLHKASGRALPQVVDAKTNEMIENMKEIGLGRRLLGNTTAIASVAIAASHMISAADLARKLDRVETKLDLLLIYRRIDQQAAVERIYAFAREILSEPLGEAERIQLWQLRLELRELRATWRREIEHHIEQIENPAHDKFFDWIFTSRDTYDKNILNKISEGELRLFWIEYTLRLDRVLAASGGTWDQSLLSLKDELESLWRVKILLDQKTQFISKEKQKSAESVSKWIGDIGNGYGKLLPISHKRNH